MSISAMFLKDTATTIKAPDHTTTTLSGGLPTYNTITGGTNVKCRLVPEVQRVVDGALGRWPTGRYQILFDKGLAIEVGYLVTISGVDYMVEETNVCTTHTECWARKR